MWIFTQGGFFSIVEHRDDPTTLIVRSRVKGDIEKYWPNAKVSFTPDADYLYRAYLSKKEAADTVRLVVSNIDYDNFKDHIDDKRRGRWYMKVWEVMWNMQQSLANTGR